MITTLLCKTIHLYQKYSANYSMPCCRFYPTCSEYTLQAIQTLGPLKGLWIGAIRILKCNPFHPGGVDEIGVQR